MAENIEPLKQSEIIYLKHFLVAITLLHLNQATEVWFHATIFGYYALFERQ